MKPELQYRLHQQLTLTPQLQQAIRLLQLSHSELETELRQMAEGNPLLEIDEPALTEHPRNHERLASLTEPTPVDSRQSVAEWSGDRSNGWEQSLCDEVGDGYSESKGEIGMLRGHVINRPADEGFYENQRPTPITLQSHLMWQLDVAHFNARDYIIATFIIDALNTDGYLSLDAEGMLDSLPADIGATPGDVERVRKILQTFEPAGIASLDVRDCLRYQLEQLAPTPERRLALALLDTELSLLARHDIAKLAQTLHVTDQEVNAAVTIIRSLNPRPGAALDITPAEYVIPDVYARKDGYRWRVTLNPDCQPRIGLSEEYCRMMANTNGREASWLRTQYQEARWLLKSLESRAETLFRVAEAIVNRQNAFLDYGPEAMRPMVLREIAEEMGVHESTVSRVTTRKYLSTPRGTFELKYFFSSSITTQDGGGASATAIQAMLLKLIENEDTRHPLSDQDIVHELRQRGIQVARRTVAKYRGALHILNSNERMRSS